MSVAAAAVIDSTLYVYYYSSNTAPFGTVYSISSNGTANLMLIQGQNVTGPGTSPINNPSSAWMFPNSNNELILLIQQSTPLIITLKPQGTLAPPVNPVPYTNPTANNFNWTFTDQSQVPNLIPSSTKQLWIASGNTGISTNFEGSALYEIYSSYGGSPPVLTSYVNKVDLSNLATQKIPQKPLWSTVAGNIDPSSFPRVVRLPGSVVSNVSVVAIGKCTSATHGTPSSGTCMSFFIDSSPSQIASQPQANPAYDPTSCIIATNSLIVMVTKTGIWTIDYTVSPAALQAATWGSVSKSVLPNAPLSCSVSGTQLFVVLQGGLQPTIVVTPMTGTWAWQTQTLTTPSVISSPMPAPTGSTGQSGGPPDASGNSSIDGNSKDHNGSQRGSSSTGLGKPVIIAIAVIAVVLLILIPTLFIRWCRRKRQNGKEREQRTYELKQSIILEHEGGKRTGSPQTTVIEHGGGKRMGSPQTIVLEHGDGSRMGSPHTIVLEHGGGIRMGSPHTHPGIDPAHASLTLVGQ